MTYTQLEDIGELNLRTLLNFPNLDTPIFYPVMLFVIFMVFTMGSFFREVKREGRGNLMASLAVGGYITTAIAFILSLLTLVQNMVVVVTLVISLVFQVIYLLTKRK